jgi:release factor glutamine methyltransferase
LTLSELLGELSAELAGRHEALIVLEEATGGRSASLLARGQEQLSPEILARARALAARCVAGEPLQQVIGHWSFRRLDLLQDGRALIVRPETEFVAEVALTELDRQKQRLRPLRAVDLGTGSGAIALSLAGELDGLEVLATDRSLPALALAAANRGRLRDAVASRVALLASDWYSAIAPRRVFELIVANPPYLSQAEWAALDPVVRDFDPKEALVAGASGLEAVEQVLAGAPERLVDGGSLVVEIGASQGAVARSLATGAGASVVRIAADLVGRDRVLVARF